MRTNNGIAITTLITAALVLILLSSIFTATANQANAKKHKVRSEQTPSGCTDCKAAEIPQPDLSFMTQKSTPSLTPGNAMPAQQAPSQTTTGEGETSKVPITPVKNSDRRTVSSLIFSDDVDPIYCDMNNTMCSDGYQHDANTTYLDKQVITTNLTTAQLDKVSLLVFDLKVKQKATSIFQADCLNQVGTFLNLATYAMQTGKVKIIDHLATQDQALPSCFGSHAEPITQVS